MEFYKPYPFLYKDSGQNQLTVSFIVYLDAEETLSKPTITEGQNSTKFEFTIVRDTSQPSNYQKEVNRVIQWNGNDHKVTIVIGSGGGGTGGTAIVSSADFD